MMSLTARADFFDASALVRLYVDEPGATEVRIYFQSRTTKYTTQFCFYEALSVLKSNWRDKGRLTKEQYLNAAYNLTVWYNASAQEIDDLDFRDLQIFRKARLIAESNALDLSDAFQILSVKYGYFSPLVNESQTVLVTADKILARVARQEDLRVWSVLEEAAP